MQHYDLLLFSKTPHSTIKIALSVRVSSHYCCCFHFPPQIKMHSMTTCSPKNANTFIIYLWWYQINLLNESIRKLCDEFHLNTKWVISCKWYWMLNSSTSLNFKLTLCYHFHNLKGGFLFFFFIAFSPFFSSPIISINLNFMRFQWFSLKKIISSCTRYQNKLWLRLCLHQWSTWRRDEFHHQTHDKMIWNELVGDQRTSVREG